MLTVFLEIIYYYSFCFCRIGYCTLQFMNRNEKVIDFGLFSSILLVKVTMQKKEDYKVEPDAIWDVKNNGT